jgi:hypothetical protein
VLPAGLVASLDDAFASEVALRLPRLLVAATRLADGAPDAASEIMSDTHALASSATVVGEDLAAYAARECELLVLTYLQAAEPADVRGIAGQVAGAIDALRLALARWIDPSMFGPVLPPQSAGYV